MAFNLANYQLVNSSAVPEDLQKQAMRVEGK